MAYFPLYVDLTGRKCVIAGGGEVALRKAKVLLDFDARVTVIAPEISDKLKKLSMDISGHLTLIPEEISREALRDAFLVVAATDDEELNHQIADYCREQRIPVNTVDRVRDCSFIFSSYVKQKDLVASFSSGGSSPMLTQILKQKEQEILTPFLGEINEHLGKLRKEASARIPEETARKEFYRSVYELALSAGRLPTEEETEKLFQEIWP